MDEITGDWRKLNNEGLHNLYQSPNIIRQFKSRRMRWAVHMASRKSRQKCTRFWWGSPKEGDRSDGI
jgi:hypothetical protein